jgi:hypothetical protein
MIHGATIRCETSAQTTLDVTTIAPSQIPLGTPAPHARIRAAISGAKGHGTDAKVSDTVVKA